MTHHRAGILQFEMQMTSLYQVPTGTEEAAAHRLLRAVERSFSCRAAGTGWLTALRMLGADHGQNAVGIGRSGVLPPDANRRQADFRRKVSVFATELD